MRSQTCTMHYKPPAPNLVSHGSDHIPVPKVDSHPSSPELHLKPTKNSPHPLSRPRNPCHPPPHKRAPRPGISNAHPTIRSKRNQRPASCQTPGPPSETSAEPRVIPPSAPPRNQITRLVPVSLQNDIPPPDLAIERGCIRLINIRIPRVRIPGAKFTDLHSLHRLKSTPSSCVRYKTCPGKPAPWTNTHPPLRWILISFHPASSQIRQYPSRSRRV